MKKKRKTRSEKIYSDMRSTPSLNTTSLPLPDDSTTHTQTPRFTTSYHFVRTDLQKTTLITCAIVIAELVLFFVIKP